MTHFLQLIFLLAVILLAAKLAGYLGTRLGQPSVLGELLVGVLLGPSLLNLLHLPFLDGEILGETITEFAELGVLLLMFIAGLELHLDELRHTGRVAALAGALGVFVPVGMGWGLGVVGGLETNSALFLGLILAATSVSISAQTLMEMRVLRSRVGLSLLGAAVFDDILVILLLSLFLAFLSGGGSLLGLLWVVARMLIFLAGSVALGLWGLPWLSKRVAALPVSQGVLTLALVVMMIYGLAAELVGGMAAITGAFIAGLMFARCPEKERIEPGVVALAYSLFVPVFFVNIGLAVDVRGLPPTLLWLTLGMIVVALASKLLGGGVGARLAGFSWRESVQLGAGMISRGEVGLIVASVGINAGLIAPEIFTTVVATVLVSTLVTPPILRALFRPPKEA